MFARAMIDHGLADAETAGGRQYRNKPVKASIQIDFIEDFAAVQFESAVVIVQLHFG